jgi:hypothetical protein
MPSLRCFGVVAGALVLAACGSDPAPAKSAQVGTSSDVLDEVLSDCTDFGRRLCESAAPCCEQAAPFVEDDCVATYVANVCTPSAQLVAAGLATYDATAADDCLAAHQRAYSTCVADWDETVAIRRELWASCRVIDGTLAEGQTCDDDARCALPDGDATAACVEGVCRTIELLPEGATCPFPNGDVSTCDLGLYCTASAPDETGTCVPATAEGDMCDPVFLNMECGLGSYCDLTEAVCKKATNVGGPSCSQDTECVSFVCDRAAQTCSTPLTTAASLCGGM